VPAVIVARLNPPLAALSVPVKPAPIVIVFESGYLKITTPEPPDPDGPPPEFPVPPPPDPVFTLPSVAKPPDPVP
jgi:hypothetical protein